MKKTTIKTSSASRLNTYKDLILFTLEDYEGLYVGIKADYQKIGEYDNSSGTLKKITDNKKLYSLITGRYSHIALAGLINKGSYTINDIIEFYQVCKKLNLKHYDNMTEADNKFFYKFNRRKNANN